MSDPTTTTIVSPDPARKFLGHPLGLVSLFSTEFFERFTYYGMRALLVLFLVAATTGANPGFGVDAATAGAVYGLYTGAVYLAACLAAGSPTASSVNATRCSGVASSSPRETSSCRFPPRRRCSISASRSSSSA